MKKCRFTLPGLPVVIAMTVFLTGMLMSSVCHAEENAAGKQVPGISGKDELFFVSIVSPRGPCLLSSSTTAMPDSGTATSKAGI